LETKRSRYKKIRLIIERDTLQFNNQIVRLIGVENIKVASTMKRAQLRKLYVAHGVLYLQ
jgi:hypothetical protein